MLYVQDKDNLRQEILVAKEAMELAREKFSPIEHENKQLKYEMERVKEVRRHGNGVTSLGARREILSLYLRQFLSSCSDNNYCVNRSLETTYDVQTNLGKHVVSNFVCTSNQRYTNDSVFWLTHLMFCFMMLSKFLPCVGPNLILNAPTELSNKFSLSLFLSMDFFNSLHATQNCIFNV